MKKVLFLIFIEIAVFSFVFLNPLNKNSYSDFKVEKFNTVSTLSEESTSITIATDSKELKLKEINEIPVTVFAGANVSSLSFSLLYDDSLIEVVGVKSNKNLLGSFNYDISTIGVINISYNQNENINVLKELFIIEVKVKDLRALGTETKFWLNTNYDNKFYTLVNNEATLINDYNFIFGTIRIALRGDINLDDVVDIEDVLLIHMWTKNKFDIPNDQRALANINGDFRLDLSDAYEMQGYLLGLNENMNRFSYRVRFNYSDKYTDIYVQKGWPITNLPELPYKSGVVYNWNIEVNTIINGDKDISLIETISPIGLGINGPYILNVGEEYTYTVTYYPENAKQGVIWTSRDESIATIDENGKLTALKAGIVEIYATSKVNNRVMKRYTIQINQPIVYEEPTGVEIIATMNEFRVNSFINLRVNVLPLPTTSRTGALQEVTWTSSNEAVATVSATGRVYGVGEGTATIRASSVSDPNIFDTLDVTVISGIIVEPFDPIEIKVYGESSVEEGYKITLVASVLPTGISQNVIWEALNPNIATISSQGIVTGLKAGTAYFKVKSAIDPNIYENYMVTVTPSISVNIKNMNQYEIVVMVPVHELDKYDPRIDRYNLLDKQAKLKSIEDTEALFNTKITFIGFPETAGWGSARINWIIEKAELNIAETDIFVSTTDWVARFAEANATVDVSQFYSIYGKNSMDPDVNFASSYKAGLYALPSSDVGSIKPYHGLFFNVNLVNDLGLEDPARLFNEGVWTWSKFEEYVKEATSVLADDQSVLSGKPAGLYYGMVNSAGVKLVDPQTMSLNFTNSYAINAASLIRDLYITPKVWGDNKRDSQNVSFNTGKSLFQVAEYWFLKDASRFQKDMWGEGTTDFGYVPFPYPDHMDKSETRVSYQGGSIYQMSKGRVYPAGITAELVYQAFTYMTLNTTKLMNNNPDMSEEILMKVNAEAKLDDIESVNAITYFGRDKVIYDPYYSILSSSGYAGRMIDDVVVLGKDYYEVIDIYQPQYLFALNDRFG